MNRYEIRCTPEQTLKALKLGAPIECYVESDGVRFPKKNPTAEQMIGWLEEQGIYGISIEEFEGDWIYHIRIVASTESINNEDYPYDSRKKVTLVAISDALDYLKTNKNEK